jgi:hypothetical protein
MNNLQSISVAVIIWFGILILREKYGSDRWNRLDRLVKWDRRLMRIVRVALGAGIGYLGFHVLSWAQDTLSRPFASLSPMLLVDGIAAGFAGCGLVGVAFSVAFDKAH